jgi:hypothetical protein
MFKKNQMDINLQLYKTIEAIDNKLVELDRDRELLVRRKQLLLNKSSEIQDAVPDKPLALSVNQKVELFKGLFKGRSDVFAHRWTNSQGRSGYSFSCENEWKKGLCHKPKIKCNQCSNRKYKPLGNQVIYNHLKGKQVVGLYPLLGKRPAKHIY